MMRLPLCLRHRAAAPTCRQAAIKKLVDEAQDGDILVLHFSGHGTQARWGGASADLSCSERRQGPWTLWRRRALSGRPAGRCSVRTGSRMGPPDPTGVFRGVLRRSLIAMALSLVGARNLSAT
jgi:hypothetical protein